MKKLINGIDGILSESLRGFGAAHADLVAVSLDPKYVLRATPKARGKVALVSGGGSGHEPLHAGFVGAGMLDAACPGEVFTSPTPDQMLAAAQAADAGGGLLFVVKNYSGDVMNFEMAAEMLADAPGGVATVLTNDDVAVEDSTFSQGRRGVAGTVIVEKIVGAAAERGADLAACQALGERVNKATGSLGVALTSCTVPAAGRPTFDLGEDEMELGVGIHGEPGRRRVPLMPADEIAEAMVSAICESTGPKPGEPLLLLLNGMGASPQMELYLMYEAARRLCEDRGLAVARSLVGNYCTSLDMAGCSLTLTRMDEALLDLWDAPVHTAALRWGM
ncbi:dihydroxyacetone kinase DhaK subunit [Tistlia consotensis]|uniref:phosphoenolpyruvate--glycerone phosphotransferase n=1 Tax=Tistlia consotensis USBA 355 TaxID=560819 RepID=A0A1Y6CB76_9PROT|nr:dihydroxyacetone kinase subunit DhaK [Tistlia consotensis]SMF55240.1 dihydroxyacetone kinase DhaK subunit [Tistlia consotensis USBA 355]SNR87962.1 dihydroxyacetone kinase DhaK subunit [Tistlia consotensis]